MKPRFLPFLLLIVALGTLPGCSGGLSGPAVPLPEAPGEGWIRNPLEDTAIFLSTDDAMAKLVDIQNLTAYSTRAGGLKASCHLHNLTKQPLAIQLRALFRRADGTTLEESAWKSVTLPVSRFIPFEVVNESGNAARVLIEMRVKDSQTSSAPPPLLPGQIYTSKNGVIRKGDVPSVSFQPAAPTSSPTPAAAPVSQ